MRLAFLTGRWNGLPIPQVTRRIAVVVALAAYPLVLAAWYGLRGPGVPGIVWLAGVSASLAVLLIVDRGLWSWQNSLARQPDGVLDERQIAVRLLVPRQCRSVSRIAAIEECIGDGRVDDDHSPNPDSRKARSMSLETHPGPEPTPIARSRGWQ